MTELKQNLEKIQDRSFFQELNGTATGVAFKNLNFKKELLSYLAKVESATVADLCKELGLSTPKVTTLINSLIDDGLIEDYGKVESTGGRKPNLFGLTSNSAFFIGVDIKQNHINIGLSDLQKRLIEIKNNIRFKLDNNVESLDTLCSLINEFINGTSIPREKILGLGINLSGRVNYSTGYSYSFYNFSEEPLSEVISSKIGIKVFIENDSRAMAYGEFCAGVVKDEKNVLFLNLDYGIGLGILINGQLYYGKSGFSGEIGHIPLFKNELLCHCGKKGCLETEASGWALTRFFIEKIKQGSTSSVTHLRQDINNIQLKDIIQAAHKDDVLAIELIAKIGENLGRALAVLINLYNPELVILGGSLATTQDYISLPIKSAINKYALNLTKQDTVIKISLLGERAGIIGACLLARNRLLT
ncbi:ROK family transcriptional regulator [Pseudoxanthomonas sp. SGD-10]|nr:ROK family transcriptional regulator [Pseudoxanthomonas sp. SGD-10]